jgi:tetratricopeptide (TPR) repeat protein
MLSSCALTNSSENDISEVPIPTDIVTDTASESQPIIPEKEKIQLENSEKSDENLSGKNKTERIFILKKKVDSLTANSQYTEALRTYERILKLEPSDDIERKTASAAFQAKDFEKAIKYYRNQKNNLSL